MHRLGKSDEIREQVRKRYGQAATAATSSCCSEQTGEITAETPGKFVQMAGYTADELVDLPKSTSSLGCGNPVNFIDVKPGQTVLDLGSGTGLDLILAARKVGPTGRVIGLDMTPEMIDVCSKNLAEAGITNGEVREGLMEAMPVADREVDWIISNCVINLSPEKEKVFDESYRVLKPGGRLLVSDIVTNDLPNSYRDDILAWVGCLAGAVEEEEYCELMRRAGFAEVRVVDKLVYDKSTLAILAEEPCTCCDNRTVSAELIEHFANRVASVKVSALKPE